MIHYVSIPAEYPDVVAKALVELTGGRNSPFPGRVPGARMVVCGDAYETMIEVYPADVVLRPGYDDEEAVCAITTPSPYHSFHLMLSVSVSRDTIKNLGDRMGWRTQLCSRGSPGRAYAFQVTELWVENHFLIEIVTAEMADIYLRFIQFQSLDRLFAEAA